VFVRKKRAKEKEKLLIRALELIKGMFDNLNERLTEAEVALDACCELLLVHDEEVFKPKKVKKKVKTKKTK